MPLELTAEIESEEVEKYLYQIKARGGRPPLRRISVVGVKSVLKNFRASGRPDKWKPLAAKMPKKTKGETKKSARAKTNRRAGGKPLLDSTAMMKSVHAEHIGVTNTKITTSHPNAAHHQYGTGTFGKRGAPYWIGPKGKKALKFVTSGGSEAFSLGHFHPGIEARPFVGWQTEDAVEIQKICADHLLGVKGIL